MYKQFACSSYRVYHFLNKKYYFERLILQLEQIATDMITSVNNWQEKELPTHLMKNHRIGNKDSVYNIQKNKPCLSTRLIHNTNTK